MNAVFPEAGFFSANHSFIDMLRPFVSFEAALRYLPGYLHQ